MNGFQRSFAAALLDTSAAMRADVRTLARQPAFAVYRNTVLKGCVDALEGNFPTVLRLVGPDWFRSAALAYARGHPPADARLLFYGDEGFGGFLQSIPTAAQLPYLAGVAHLDTLWRAAHAAADAAVQPASALAALAPETLGALVLRPHPAARWAWFEAQPVASLWLRHRAGAEDEAAMPAWQAEGLLLTRPHDAVQWALLPRAGCTFLDACARCAPLGEAAEAALCADPQADLAALLRQLLQVGAFLSTSLPESPCHGQPALHA